MLASAGFSHAVVRPMDDRLGFSVAFVLGVVAPLVVVLIVLWLLMTQQLGVEVVGWQGSMKPAGGGAAIRTNML